MRVVRPWLIAIVVFSAVSAVGGAAQAARPSCADLTSALSLGHTQEQVAREFATTQARVAACVGLDAQEALHASQRERFESRRAERGLPIP